MSSSNSSSKMRPSVLGSFYKKKKINALVLIHISGFLSDETTFLVTDIGTCDTLPF